MSLETGIIALAEAVGGDVKALNVKIGDLSQLTTTAKDNLVEAINEAAASGGGGGVQIDDNAGAGDTAVVWSADKTATEIQAATPVNGVGFGQNIINFAVSGDGNISYSGTLQSNTTGVNNTAVGGSALQNNTKGSENTATGVNALRDNTTGYSNTAAGSFALRGNTTGRFNTAAGGSALQNNTTGRYNTAVGRGALQNNTAYNNCGGFGYNSEVTGSNQIQLGDSETTVYAYGAVQNRSDARDKTEIRDTVLGLDFINAIRPVDYKLDMREDYRIELGENPTKEQLEDNKLANIQTDGTHTRKRYHHGVIAQQVAEVMDALGVDFGGFQDHSKIGGDDVLSIGYEEFIAPLIKAVQELSARVKELEIKVEP